MNIAICDDAQEVHKIMEIYIKQFTQEFHIDCEVHSFYSGEELLENKEKMDILFLDVMMPEMDGVETAKKLNRKLYYKIIMLTGSPEYFQDAFKIGAFRYLLKPIIQSDLFEAMEAVAKELPDYKTFQMHYQRQTYQILEKDITYLEANKGIIIIYTEKGDYTSSLSLKKWEEVLSADYFARVHKGYIVNLKKVVGWDKKFIYLTLGEKVPISKRNQKWMTQRLSKYLPD